MNRSETVTRTVNGKQYERWEEIRVTREIDRMCTDFNVAVSERFLGSADHRVKPGDKLPARPSSHRNVKAQQTVLGSASPCLARCVEPT